MVVLVVIGSQNKLEKVDCNAGSGKRTYSEEVFSAAVGLFSNKIAELKDKFKIQDSDERDITNVSASSST